MNERQIGSLEQICTHIYLDAAEFRERLPRLVKQGDLREAAGQDIAHWADDIGAAVDLISPHFKKSVVFNPEGVDLHVSDITDEFSFFSASVIQYMSALGRHKTCNAVLLEMEKLGKNIRQLVPEYERAGLVHGFGFHREKPRQSRF